jgi:uncharacterized integral membrane protein
MQPQQKARAHSEAADRRRTIAAAVLGGLIVLFAVLNLDEVEVNWIVATWETPLIVVIAVALAIGGALGYLVSVRRKGRRGGASPQ